MGLRRTEVWGLEWEISELERSSGYVGFKLLVYGGGHWGSERARNLPKVTQQSG